MKTERESNFRGVVASSDPEKLAERVRRLERAIWVQAHHQDPNWRWPAHPEDKAWLKDYLTLLNGQFEEVRGSSTEQGQINPYAEL